MQRVNEEVKVETRVRVADKVARRKMLNMDKKKEEQKGMKK